MNDTYSKYHGSLRWDLKEKTKTFPAMFTDDDTLWFDTEHYMRKDAQGGGYPNNYDRQATEEEIRLFRLYEKLNRI